MSRFTVNELARHVSGRVEGDGTLAVTGTAPVEKAGKGDVTFLVGERYLSRLKQSNPTAVLIPEDMDRELEVPARIRVPDPRHAFSRLLELFHPEEEGEPGVAPSAVIARGVRLGPGVRIGPHVVLEEEVRVGAGTRIDALTTVEVGAHIGRDCRIASGCTVCGSVRMGDRVRVGPGARLGTQGYGFTEEEREAVRMPQVGRCVIGDDVEIGANTTIDRGALGDTVVGARTKIDNLVHVGHNVRIGEDCMIVAQVGIAGSVEVGDRVQMAGQAGIAGHLTIGDGARIAAQAGVIGDVPEEATYSGYPARPHRRALRASAALFRFPDLLKRMERLEDRLEDMRDGREEAGG